MVIGVAPMVLTRLQALSGRVSAHRDTKSNNLCSVAAMDCNQGNLISHIHGRQKQNVRMKWIEHNKYPFDYTCRWSFD